MTTATNVITKLETLIEDAAGSAISPAAKAKMTAIGAVIGALVDDLAPAIENRFDLNDILSGVEQVETGADQIDTGIKAIIAAARSRPATTTNSPAA